MCTACSLRLRFGLFFCFRGAAEWMRFVYLYESEDAIRKLLQVISKDTFSGLREYTYFRIADGDAFKDKTKMLIAHVGRDFQK